MENNFDTKNGLVKCAKRLGISSSEIGNIVIKKELDFSKKVDF